MASTAKVTNLETKDRYEIIDSEHGEGGFGKISKQRDLFLERFVAVKTQHLLDDAKSRERFTREAKTLAKMSHPNIPAIYDVKVQDEEMLIYFEFIEGNNLRGVVNSGEPPSLEQAVRWFSQVASAIEHAASLKIVHRDIKPDNIIISQNGNAAYLVDFGIAIGPDDSKRITEKGYVVGTPAYMSPEQREGKELDEASDIYSLGITLYETLSGRLPVGGGYDSISDANESIPPGIDELIKDCLIADKTKRLGSPRDFAKRLQGAVRTDAPLSSLLVEARLHELYAALKTMSDEEFSAKPLGQRLLIINRAKDLVRSDKPQMGRATADMLALLVRLAVREPQDHYQTIVEPAYEWGYDKEYGERAWQGNEEIRDALIEAGKSAPTGSHSILSESLIKFVEKSGLDDKPGWYYHDLRLNSIGLLANPHSDDSSAAKVAALYNRVNELSH